MELCIIRPANNDQTSSFKTINKLKTGDIFFGEVLKVCYELLRPHLKPKKVAITQRREFQQCFAISYDNAKCYTCIYEF